jgi:hypothetical protein
MNEIVGREREHAFSIDLKSRQYLKSLRVGDNGRKFQVFIEGFLGELSELKLVEESMLEISGTNGTLRLDITSNDLSHIIKAARHGGDVQ